MTEGCPRMTSASPAYSPVRGGGLSVTYAMILGCNGQDGTFLCRRLVDARLGTVVGIGLELQSRFNYDPTWFKYVSLDLTNESAPLRALLAETRPHLIFHVAAVHASAESALYEPVFESMLAVNVRTVHTILEHLRNEDGLSRFIYANSAKAFGSPLPEVINENTPRMSSCLYGITKNAASDLLRHYRSAHRVLASQLYLFNHESELRPQGFHTKAREVPEGRRARRVSRGTVRHARLLL